MMRIKEEYRMSFKMLMEHDSIPDETKQSIKETFEVFREGLTRDREDFIFETLGWLMGIVGEHSPSFEKLDELISCNDVPISKRLYHQIDKLLYIQDNKIASTVYITFWCLKDLYKPDVNEVVYFIRNSIGRTKIGFTSNLTKRFSSLLHSSGDDLTITFTYNPKNYTISEMESRLHMHYCKYRVFGEWFLIPEEEQYFFKICSYLDY